MSDFEVQGLAGWSADLGKAAVQALPAVRAVTEANGTALRDQWRTNARATAGKHGKWYPSSITDEGKVTPGAVTVEVGPDSSKRQGGMGRGFEYGSVHQPPHLDGNKAAEVIAPKFASEIEIAAAGLL